MAIKTFTAGQVLTASDTNTYLANSGLVYVQQTAFTSLTTWAMDNVFTSTYRNYRVVVDANGSSDGNVMRMTLLNSSGVEITTGYYGGAYWFDYATPSATVNVTGGTTFMPLGYISSNTIPNSSFVFDVVTPQIASLSTTLSGTHTGLNAGTAFAAGFMNGSYNTAATTRGFYLKNSAGTAMSGSISVYGYRQV